jgi:hypothetical protein
MQSVLTELDAMPADQPVRLIVRTPDADAATIARAETAVRNAGAAYVGRMGAQPMLAIEATPAQARAIAASGAITGMQIDRTMRPQN